MKLEKYDVAIIISEPGLDLDDREATTTVAMTLREVPREKMLAVKLPLAGLLKQFEELVVEDAEPLTPTDEIGGGYVAAEMTRPEGL